MGKTHPLSYLYRGSMFPTPIKYVSLFLVCSVQGACVDRESVDSACANNIGGASNATHDAIHYFSRVNCYRRYAGMGKVRIEKHIQEATVNHASYLTMNFDPSLPWDASELELEDPSKEGFTGVDGFQRIDRESYVNATSHGAWTHTDRSIPADRSPSGWAAVVDEEMHHFIFRQKFLQPRSWGVGLAVDGMWRYSFEVYNFPADSHVNKPVVYPRNGQVDVPTTSYNYWGFDGYEIPEGDTGFHITATVGSIQGGTWLDMNPYDLVASNVNLTDEQGADLEFWLITPDSVTPGPFLYTVAVVPKAPLAPSTTYTMTAQIDWVDGTKMVETTFTTAEEE